jgi:hypothetical protein
MWQHRPYRGFILHKYGPGLRNVAGVFFDFFFPCAFLARTRAHSHTIQLTDAR